MVGKQVSELTFKRTNQIVNMAFKDKSSNGMRDTVIVDPMLPFQRLIKVVEDSPAFLEDALAFEMSRIPALLFDSDGFPRKKIHLRTTYHREGIINPKALLAFVKNQTKKVQI